MGYYSEMCQSLFTIRHFVLKDILISSDTNVEVNLFSTVLRNTDLDGLQFIFQCIFIFQCRLKKLKVDGNIILSEFQNVTVEL